MSETVIDCWNCGVELQLKPGRSLKFDATCPECGEYLQDGLSQNSAGSSGSAGSFGSKSRSRRGDASYASSTFDRETFGEIDHSEGDYEPRGLLVGVIVASVVAAVLVFGIGLFMLQRGKETVVGRDLKPTGNTSHRETQVQPQSDAPESSPVETPQSVVQTPSTSPHAALVSNPQSSNGDSAVESIKRNQQDGASVARFTFADGDDYQFKYEVSAEFDNRKEVTTGTSTLKVLGRDKQQSVTQRAQEGSGTAFVVSANGILVTCAHVVDDATDIQVQVNGKLYAAEVLESNAETDLAILKIDAQGLQAIPLADSGAEQLGQDVRAVGFPLSDVLGTEVKVTRGTISGIIQRDGQKQLQIDAAVNPGNSGGPVVNSRGEVLGVASAKLSGAEIHRVGFCVPVKQVRDMLEKTGSPVAKSTVSEDLDGPQLVTKVTPAVAFVKVKAGEDVNAKHSELSFSGSFHQSFKDLRNHFIPSFRMRGSQLGIGRGTLLITHMGEVVRATDEEQLPFLIGPPSQLALFELREGKKNSWTTKKETSLIQERQETTTSGIPLPRFRDPFGGRRNSEVVKVLPAVEIKKFKIASEDDKVLVVEMDYDFHTTVSDNGQIIKMIGVGTYKFDKVRGFTSNYDFKGTYMVESDQVTVKVPLTVTGSLLSKQEIEAQKAQVAAAQPDSGFEPAAVNSLGTAPNLKKNVKQQIPEMGWGIKSLKFSPDGRFVAAGKSDDFVEIYDVETGRKLFTEGRLREMGNISTITFSPDGKYLLAGGFKGLIKIWELAENGLLSPIGEFTGHTREVTQIIVSPDSQHVLSGGADKRVLYWDMKTQQEVFAQAEFESSKFGFHFLNDESALISDGRVLKKLSLPTGNIEQTFQLRTSGSANNVFFSPDGSEVTLTDGYSLKRWTTADGKSLPELKGKEMLWDADYTPDGRKIVAGGRGHLILWDLEKQDREGHVLLGDSIMYVKPLDVSHDGRYVACYPSSAGQSLWIFDLGSEQQAAD